MPIGPQRPNRTASSLPSVLPNPLLVPKFSGSLRRRRPPLAAVHRETTPCKSEEFTMDSESLLDPMRLKLKELLKEVEVDFSPTFTKLVDDTVSAIRGVVDDIPEGLQVTADEALGFVKDVGADKVDFKFRKPKSMEIGGSYSIHCIVKPDVRIDLFVRLPKECFHEKDYLNYRYHAKRCLYLCIIKKYLEASSSFGRVEWSSLQSEARKPILLVYPGSAPADIPGFHVKIIPTATSLLNKAKLNAIRNNLHKGNVSEATPKYNCSILEDMLMEEHSEFVKQTFLDQKELCEALIFLKIWCASCGQVDERNTNLSSNIGLHWLNWTSLMRVMKLEKTVYLLVILTVGCLLQVPFESETNRIHSSSNRLVAPYAANSKSWEKGLSFWSPNDAKVTKEEMKMRRMQHRQSFPVVICDPSGYLNIAFRLSKYGFAELRNEAAMTITLACPDKCRGGGFEETFLTKVDFSAKYDYCIRLNLKGNANVHASGYCMDDECWRLYEEKVCSILAQGLQDRAKTVRVSWRNMASNHRVEDGFSSLDKEPLLVGVTLDSVDKALRVVDIGPDADKREEAVRYRKFWGEKAELRRFTDGRIAESTVWECKQWERHLIMKRIVEHVLSRHLSLSNEHVMVTSDQLDFSLIHGSQDPISSTPTVLEAYDVLSKRLRLLKDIPLSISSVQPLDSAFRFTSVFPPEPHPLIKEKGKGFAKLGKRVETCVQPLEVLIQLEGSGNWPMDSVATEKTKHVFLLKIGESMENNWGMTCVATEENVDMLFSGFAFRLKILHERGLHLLKGSAGGNRVKQVSSIDKILLLRSQHCSMINGLQGRYPIYGPVVRIAKRWAASHLFSTCLADEAIELLVASLFLKPWPFDAPSSRITGFLRFLRMLSEYPWNFYPLIVDINGDLTSEDEKAINENFMLSRKGCEESPQNVNCAMFLATIYDKQSEAWAYLSPTPLELKRLVAYARSSGNLLTQLISQHQNDSIGWERLFQTPLNNYDAVVLLHGNKLAHPERCRLPSEVNQGFHIAQGDATKDFNPFLAHKDMKGNLDEVKQRLMVDFDPLRCYIEDLERDFPHIFKLWYDGLGGDAIGLTWTESPSKKRGREDDVKEDVVSILRSVVDQADNVACLHSQLNQSLRYFTIEEMWRRRLTTATGGADSIRSLSTKKWDAIVIGGGHNGLTAAAYLARSGLSVAVLERRHLIGGASVTEELIPGFRELELDRHGLRLLKRNPSSFTPCLDGRYLMLGPDEELNRAEISKFSNKDAENYPRYEAQLENFCKFLDPILDSPTPETVAGSSSLKERMKNGLTKSRFWAQCLRRAASLGQKDMVDFMDLLLSPASKVLNNWFEVVIYAWELCYLFLFLHAFLNERLLLMAMTEVLKATLATDAVIGTTGSVHTPGSGYVLLHHVMGETNGDRGIWSYVEGGMGSVSLAISKAAKEVGAHIVTNAEVSELMVGDSETVNGVLLADGTRVHSSIVLSNATPYRTFVELVPEGLLADDFLSAIKNIDYSSATTKINLAVDALPQFQCCKGNTPLEAGKHVINLFIQYTPYAPSDGSWKDPAYRESFAKRCFSLIDEYAPGFSSSILGYDMLTPPDLEREIGLTGGNIFHGAMGLDSLFLMRPIKAWSSYRTPLQGLYLCGSGTHPGGGVMGAPGRNAAHIVLQDLRRK
ncbi:Pyridine nucleotide-disulfide oxidoreductase domain-containing protein [Drosera capensis]